MKRYIKGVLPYIIIEILLDIAATVMVAVVPYLQKLLFDVGIDGGYTTLIKIAIAFAAVQILSVILGNLCMRFTWKGAIKFEKKLKRDFFHAVFQMKKTEFYKQDIGEYIAMQSNDITALEQDYLQPIVDIVRSINMFIIYGVILFAFVDWRIALTILLTSCLTVIGPKLSGKIMSRRRNDFQNQLATYTSRIKDLLEGFPLINTRTREKIDTVHEGVLLTTAQRRYGYGKAKTATLSINDLTIKCIQIASFFVAGILLINGEITIGTGVATFGYVASFLSPISSILYDVTAIQSVKEIKQRVLGYINDSPPVLNAPKHFQRAIKYDNINLSLGNFALHDVNCMFEKGRKYAIIGHSGSGKTTLVNLLLGYLGADSGTISIDENQISEIDTSYILSSISQHEHIFQAGYKDNATIFDSYDKKKLQQGQEKITARIMHAVFAKGENDNCQALSGGEKQALSFLRMLTSDSPVVILDEPFSAIDKKTAMLFETQLLTAKELSEKTIIMVTHDLSEHLSDFDEIILMEAGRIKISGKYHDIIQSEVFIELCASERANTPNASKR